MISFSPEKTKMPEQAPEERVKNSLEVFTGYTDELAVKEAMRCLRCREKPCMTKGCPVHNHIPDFIAKIAMADFEGAFDVLCETTSLPAVCGRVCPHDQQCQGYCVRGIKGESVNIGALERFVADRHIRNIREYPTAPETNGKKVAVVGCGPAGITCAGSLAEKGYDVTIFDKSYIPGGVLSVGIPEFRLPGDIVAYELIGLETKGVKFDNGVTIVSETDIADLAYKQGRAVGPQLTLKDLFNEGYSAIFLGNGAGIPSNLNVPGDDLHGVRSAEKYLKDSNLEYVYGREMPEPIKPGAKVLVVGGGNVAVDAARVAVREGADVTIVYRRSRSEMPAYSVEIDEAILEGVKLICNAAPKMVIGENGEAKALQCIATTMGEADSSGRASIVEVEGSEFILDADIIISAVGVKCDYSFVSGIEGLDIRPNGTIIADEETCATSMEGVYAGGDSVTGPATVILAMGAGRKAADSIDRYLSAR